MSQAASGTLSARSHDVVRFEVNARGLYVKRISLGTDDSLSMAVLGVHPQDNSGSDIRFEQVWSLVKKGQQVKITARPSQGSAQVMLHGWIQGANIAYGGRHEDLEYTVMGLDWGLKVEKVWGSWCKSGADGSAVWLRGTPPVFNKDGLYNKATQDCTDSDGNKRVVFDLDDSLFNPKSAWWNAAQMARYLVSCERKSEFSTAEGNIFEKDYQPAGEIASFRPFDVNVEDEDIWSALVKVAHRCGHGVRIGYQDDRSKTELKFFSRKVDNAQATKQLEVPRATLQTVSLQDAMKVAAALDLQDDLSGIVRRVDVVCPPKLYDAEFELLQGWLQDDEDDAFGSGSTQTKIANFLRETDPRTSSDWERFKWVGRRYILNETGRDATTTPDVGPWDFSQVFGTEPYAVRLRPFRHTRVKTQEGDEQSAPLPITVHAAFGTTMSQDIVLGENVQLLPDRAGIYFAGAPLVSVVRGIGLGSTEKFLPSSVTIEATIEGDQDSPHDASAETSGGDQPVPTFGILRLAEGFRQTNQDTDDQASQVAADLAQQVLDEMKDAKLVGTAVIPWISFAFEPGDVLDNINGRNLKVKALIAKVSYDVEQQATELALEYPSIDTATHAHHHKRTAEVGAHDGRQAEGLAFVADLLALKEMGHPVDEALQAAVGGASRAEVDRLLGDALHGIGRYDGADR